MFTFWKKKEKPVIKWWSVIDGLEKVVPIVPAKEYVPDWWTRVERMVDSLEAKGSVKNCPSMPEYMTQGFVVPLWCDLYVNVQHDKWEWRSPNKDFNFTSHGPGDWLSGR